MALEKLPNRPGSERKAEWKRAPAAMARASRAVEIAADGARALGKYRAPADAGPGRKIA
jgi:hypothetical protein